MTLEELYNLANFIIRRTNKGRPLTSDRFVEMFNKRQIDYFQELYNRFESKTSITDSLRPFKKIIDQDDISIVDNTYFALPSDYFHLSTISYVGDDGKYYPFDVVTKDQVLMRKSSFLTTPSTTYPICYEFNNNLYLEPYSSSLDLNISYLRYPNDVVLDYYISSDGSLNFLSASETYNWVSGDTDSSGNIKTGAELEYTSLTTESEWNNDDELKVLEYVLRDMGISLNDISVYQYAEMQKNES